MATLTWLLFLLLCLSSVVIADKNDVNTGNDVYQFLQRAHAIGIITDRQEAALQDLAANYFWGDQAIDEISDDNTGIGYTQVVSKVFLKTYNQFTFLNVLYFSGALLVMGAFTLFSTLAWTNFGYGGVTFILTIPLLSSGYLGIRLWDEASYPILGGLLCSVSTSMVPFTIYCLQRAMKWWPLEDPGVFQGFRTYVRGGWVVMEIVTIMTGLLYLVVFKVSFPFLLFPISWMLWFLSMDLAPFLPEWYKGWRGMFEARRILSLLFGLGMLITGRLFEIQFGSDPDFGFWLYLFGLISFWLSVTFDFPEYDLHGSLYLLLNIALCLIGSHLNRTTFHIFATLGVFIYTIGVYTNNIKPQKSFLLWLLKAFSVVGLLSQALSTGGNIEILLALVCLMAFNYNFISFIDSGIQYNTFFLVTMLGFVSCSPSFQRSLDLWLFVLPYASWVVGFVCSLSVLLYHARLFKYHFQPPDHQSIPFIYHIYRLIMCVVISLILFFLRQPAYVWVGGLGLPLIALNFSNVRFLWIQGRDLRQNISHKLFSLFTLLVGVILAIYLESNILYLACCMTMMLFILMQLGNWKIGGCIFSIGLVLISVPLQSKFIMVIAVMYIFFYLSHLAHNTFKNSMLFSLTLIGLGFSIIYIGYIYQNTELFIQEMFEEYTPGFVHMILHHPLSLVWRPLDRWDWYYHIQKTDFTYSSLTGNLYSSIFWSGGLTHALSKGTIPYVSFMCAYGIVLLLLVIAISIIRHSFRVNLNDEVKVTSIHIALSGEHNNHGIVVKIKGTKPPGLKQPVHIAMDVTGDKLWRTASNVFGKWKVKFVRSIIFPLTLTPHLISFVGFNEKRTQFSAVILLGTHHEGSTKLSHNTIRNTLQKLKRNSSNIDMTCTLLYYKSWYSPYSKLTEIKLNLEDITFSS